MEKDRKDRRIRICKVCKYEIKVVLKNNPSSSWADPIDGISYEDSFFCNNCWKEIINKVVMNFG